MRDNFIKIDFYNFESMFLGNDCLLNDNFYSTLDNKNVELLFHSFLQDNPLKKNDLDKLFVKDLYILTGFLNLHPISFEDFIYFKSELDILSSYLLLFLIKTFEIKSTSKTTRESFFDRPLSELTRDLLFDRNNFINMFSDFLQKFFLFIEIKLKQHFPLSKDSLRKFIFRFIELCGKTHLLSIKDVYAQNRHYKTLHFIPFPIDYLPHTVLYTTPFIPYIRSKTEFYAYNSQFYSLIEVTKKAKYSNSSI